MPSIRWNKDWWPKKLDEYDGEGHWGDHWGSPIPFVKKCTRGNIEGKNVLEIGPGAGRLTRHLLDAKTLILVDISREFLQYCLTRFQRSKPKMVCYETDGASLEFLQPNVVDFAVAFGVFMHLKPKAFRGYIRELSRVVKPGGKIVIDYWSNDVAPHPFGGFEYYDPIEVAGWVESANFNVTENGKLCTDATIIVATQTPVG